MTDPNKYASFPQGTTRAKVIVYPNSRFEPLGGGFRDQGPYTFEYNSRDSDIIKGVTVTAVHVRKAIGEAAGVFAIDFKSSEYDLRDHIIDDDWVDIVLYVNGKQFHAMRGLVDRVSKIETAETGVSVNVFRVVGRDFGKIFAQQQLYFDAVTRGDFLAAAMSRMYTERTLIANGAPDVTVCALLIGMLHPVSQYGAGFWRLPDSLLGTWKANFAEEVQFFARHFSNVPERSSTIFPANFQSGANTIWDLARSWSDAPLCELFVDLMHMEGRYLVAGEECDPDMTKMAVIFRDRPFPQRPRDSSDLLSAPFFTTIPEYEITRADVIQYETGRGGITRSNLFVYGSALVHSYANAMPLLQSPLASKPDVQRHGARIVDVQTPYMASSGEVTAAIASQEYRESVRDLNCLNHWLLTGQVVLNRGRPDIRVGGRLIIRDPRYAQPDENYYVEGVSHSWTYDTGVVTSLVLTHGWKGDEYTYLDAFNAVRAEYIDEVSGQLTERDQQLFILNGEASAGELSTPLSEIVASKLEDPNFGRAGF